MYIDVVPNRNSPPAILLRESYRVDGKVKKRTLLNLTDWPPDLVEGFRALLKGGIALPPGQDAIVIKRSPPHGHVAVVLGMLRKRRSTSSPSTPLLVPSSSRPWPKSCVGSVDYSAYRRIEGSSV